MSDSGGDICAPGDRHDDIGRYGKGVPFWVGI